MTTIDLRDLYAYGATLDRAANNGGGIVEFDFRNEPCGSKEGTIIRMRYEDFREMAKAVMQTCVGLRFVP